MKYELLPEEGTELLRVRALVDLREKNIRAGELGGLVGGDLVLEQTGSSWIDESSTATEEVRIGGDALVGPGCTLTGSTYVGGRARIYKSDTSEHAVVVGDAVVTRSTIDGGVVQDHTRVAESVVGGEVRGVTRVDSSFVGAVVILNSGNFHQMRVGDWSDFLQISTYWGPLTLAHARSGPGISITVGCQVLSSLKELETVAQEEAPPWDLELLPHFLAMAKIMIDRFAKENPA